MKGDWLRIEYCLEAINVGEKKCHGLGLETNKISSLYF